ncbi:MAG TPA: putative glycoside hydrolase [Gemmatimonadaceae bacterium]|nr:putative glycoside hydrolase [Gemmatimonadaceae bacterium]
MKATRIATIASLGLTVACSEYSRANAQIDTASLPRRSTAAASTVVSRDSIKPPLVHVPIPDTLRGLYVNRWAALGSKLRTLIEVAKKTEVNALVIDVKDDRGFVLYRSNVPLAREIGADTADGHWMSAAKLRAVLDTMIANDIYPIARIVVAKDPLLAHKKLELAIKRKSDLKPWLDKNGNPWLDPHQRVVWQYAADLAREAYDLGFSEVQFDYVRFPDEKRLVAETVYPLANGRPRAQVIREQLGFLRSSLKPHGMRVTADVFGLTATDTTDMGIGQRWEMFVDQVDVVLPMVYPSHFARGTFRLRNPNAHPYKTIDNVLKDVIARTKAVPNAAKIIPWYQDFTLGPPHYYAEQIRAQKKAGYDNGFQSWILWNPKSNYTVAALEPRS